MTQRDDITTRARALWTRTGSDSPHESETARKILARFLKRHNLTLADLGPRPYKDADVDPDAPKPTPVVPFGRRTAGTATGTTTGTAGNWTSWTAQDFAEAFRDTYQSTTNFQQEPEFYTDSNRPPPPPGFGNFRVMFNVGVGPTFKPIDQRRFGERVREEGARYSVHWFREWDLFACVGRSPDTAHTFVGLYADKWQALLDQYKSVKLTDDWLDYVVHNLKGTILHIRADPFPSITERNAESEWDWIELDPDDFHLLRHLQPNALIMFLNGIVQAARQWETTPQ